MTHNNVTSTCIVRRRCETDSFLNSCEGFISMLRNNTDSSYTNSDMSEELRCVKRKRRRGGEKEEV